MEELVVRAYQPWEALGLLSQPNIVLEVVMQAVFEDYLDRLQVLHASMADAIDGLPKEALDWVAGSDMNSLGVLVVHVTGSERYWIGDVVGRDPSGRDREAEFRARGWDGERLRERLADTLAHSRGVLETLTVDDLEGLRTSPRDERELRVAWSLAHALEHSALHLGHMQICRQLWDQRQEA